jgi:Cytochrome oxidase complex assembly protein 1
MNCRGCGVEIDPSAEQVNLAVDEILETSLEHAKKAGGVCPLCGHSKEVPYSHRKTVLFGLLVACLLVSIGALTSLQRLRETERAAVAKDAVARMSSNAEVVRLLGTPITIEPGLQGEIKHDETGWKEVHLTIPVHGPKGNAMANVIGGRGTGSWVPRSK